MKGMRLFLVSLVVAVVAVLPGLSAAQKTYTLGVIPQMKVSEIYERWNPFVKKLSQETGMAFELKPYDTMSQFEADLVKGAPDFAFMNPYQAMKHSKAYKPLVRDKTPLIGILVVKKEGGVQSVRELSGKQLAFPDPNAFAASLYLRALLANTEKVSFTPIYVKTHGNVYRTVILDKAAAGGGVNNTLNKETDDIKGKLRILYETPGTPPHPLAAHSRIAADVRAKVTKALMKMNQDRTNAELFKNIQMPEPEEADYEKDYAHLKKLNLDKFISKDSE
jgi:phosphonate transport system substrate-binding protein